MRPEALEGLRGALLAHYDREGRPLPWRGESDPYRILVSEIMLQQTRVETVKRYYEPWLARFPTLEALAAAPEDDVLKAWEGLGYYRRARSLHAAARAVRERGGGALPSDPADLRELPGVGEYTAGAVASIAFGHAVPAVDGNVRRVLSRLFDEPEPGAGWLRTRAETLLDRERPGDWNQALMELGATLCAPRSPACERCPVGEWCAARDAGTVEDRPARRRKAPVPTARIALGVFRAGRRVLLVRRPTGALLGGLWSFPEVEIGRGPDGSHARPAPRAAPHPTAPADRSTEPGPAAHVGADSTREVVAALGAALGLGSVAVPRPLPTCEHRFTHLQAVYLPVLVEVDAPRDVPEGAWVTPRDAEGLALPVAQRRVLDSAVAALAGGRATVGAGAGAR